jgi:cytochrome c553
VRRIARSAALALSLVGTAGVALAQAGGGNAARGAERAQNCVACHGEQGAAPQPGMPSLAAQPAQYTELQLIMMREGLRDVPAMTPFVKGLTDRDIADLAAHYAAGKLPRATDPRNAELYGRGSAISRRANCASCHGAGYVGQAQIARLAGQREDYLVDAMRAYRDNRRSGTDTNMNGIMRGVADADLRALAHYFAQQ